MMKVRYLFFSAVALLIELPECYANQIEGTTAASVYSTGITDIDQIRKEIESTPTTEENALSRHAALNRWWRFLWRQGYDMSSFDDTAKILLIRSGYSDAKLEAITRGYQLLENLAANPVYIPEIRGKPQAGTSAFNSLQSTNWPFYHGIDTAQTGYSPDPGPSEGSLAWRFPQPFIYNAVPVIDDGKIFITSPGLDVIGYCLDELSGKIEWRARQFGLGFYTTPKASLSPTVTKERVVIKTRRNTGEPHVFDKESGERITGAEINDYSSGIPVLVVSGTGPNTFQLENANTGQVIREYSSEHALLGKPVLYDGKIIILCEDGVICGYSADSHDLLWDAKLDSALRGEIEIGVGRIYAGSNDGRLFALEPKNGKVLWVYNDNKENNNSYKHYSQPAESGSRLYVGTADSQLLCLDSNTGELVWKLKFNDWIRSKPLLVEDTIYVATISGDISAVRDNGSSGELIKQVHLSDHGVSVDLTGNENGILAVGGRLMLYSLSPRTLEINWKHGILDGAWVDGTYVMADWTGGLQPSPTVYDGILYCGGMDGFVFALDADSGEEIWRFEAGGRISAAITVAEDKVFFGKISGGGEYFALDKNTGEVIWQTEHFDNVWVGASYTENGLFFGNMEGMMYGVNPSDGSIIWSSDTAKGTVKENWRSMNKRGHGFPPGIYPVPVADETKVYVGSWSGYYFAFDQRTGKELWRTQTNNGNMYGGLPDSAAPVLWKDHVYVQKIGKILAALNTRDGAIEWEYAVPEPALQNGTIAAHDDTIFASHAHRVTNIPYNATIIAFSDVENGSEELWSYKGGGGLTAPVVTNGKLITGSSCDPFVVCLDPKDGSTIWRFYTGGEMRENVPAIYGNKVYVHSTNGWLYAIK